MLTLFKLFISFAKVGIFGYGGGPSMIPLVQADVVEGYKWMTMTEFTDALAMGYALPGPIATKMAILVGYKVAGIIGSIFALLGIILPSALLILIMYIFFTSFKDSPKIKSLLKGIRPVILALLAMVVADMFPKSITSFSTIVIAVITFLILMFTSLHPVFLILAGGIAGLFLF